MKLKEQEAMKDKSDDELSMQKETYHRLLGERLDEIIKFKGPLRFFREINISLKKAEEELKKFESELGQITSGNPKYK